MTGKRPSRLPLGHRTPGTPPPADARQRLARATRFFARIHSIDLECPHCGAIYQIRTGMARKFHKPQAFFNPWTGRFTCTVTACRRTYILGILAWPVRGPGAGKSTPEDQVPTPRQLAALRAEGGGWWLADQDGQRFKRPIDTNLTLEDDRPDQGEEGDDLE